jgi:hypothetical protein
VKKSSRSCLQDGFPFGGWGFAWHPKNEAQTSLSDFILKESGKVDYIRTFVVTTGFDVWTNEFERI